MLSTKHGRQFGQERCGPWSRACLVVSELLWPLEVGTNATSVGVRMAISCCELFQCAVLIFSFGAKYELGGCALLAWLHTIPAYCHHFHDTICICAAFSHINLLLPTNVEIVPWTWFFQGVCDYFKIVPKYEPMQPMCGCVHNVSHWCRIVALPWNILYSSDDLSDFHSKEMLCTSIFDRSSLTPFKMGDKFTRNTREGTSSDSMHMLGNPFTHPG